MRGPARSWRADLHCYLQPSLHEHQDELVPHEQEDGREEEEGGGEEGLHEGRQPGDRRQAEQGSVEQSSHRGGNKEIIVSFISSTDLLIFNIRVEFASS